MSEETLIQLLGWIGCVLAIFARTAIAYKIRTGFIAAVLCGIALGIQAYIMHNPGMWVLCIVLCLIDAFGWFHWRKK